MEYNCAMVRMNFIVEILSLEYLGRKGGRSYKAVLHTIFPLNF